MPVAPSVGSVAPSVARPGGVATGSLSGACRRRSICLCREQPVLQPLRLRPRLGFRLARPAAPAASPCGCARLAGRDACAWHGGHPRSCRPLRRPRPPSCRLPRLRLEPTPRVLRWLRPRRRFPPWPRHVACAAGAGAAWRAPQFPPWPRRRAGPPRSSPPRQAVQWVLSGPRSARLHSSAARDCRPARS